MWAGTFHAIGARMLRMAPQAAGRTAAFTIYDQDDTQGVIKRVMERHRISPKQFAARAIHSAISDAKNALLSPTDYERVAADPFARAVSLVYRDMVEALRMANAVDFDDLLVLPVEMLREYPNELARYHARFRYILVDVYQDTNRAQYALIRLLGRERGNVCVVGDDDQSIYGWRGADIRNILDFGKDFGQTTTVRLEENYRSNPPILEVANAVILPNAGRMGKTLRATRVRRGTRHLRFGRSTNATRPNGSPARLRHARAAITWRSATSPCCIARTRRVARWRRACDGGERRIASSATSGSTTAARFATS